MTPTEFRARLDQLGDSQRGFAARLGWSEGTVRQWARGALPVPEAVAVWLDTVAPQIGMLRMQIAEIEAQHPPPERP